MTPQEIRQRLMALRKSISDPKVPFDTVLTLAKELGDLVETAVRVIETQIGSRVADQVALSDAQWSGADNHLHQRAFG